MANRTRVGLRVSTVLFTGTPMSVIGCRTHGGLQRVRPVGRDRAAAGKESRRAGGMPRARALSAVPAGSAVAHSGRGVAGWDAHRPARARAGAAVPVGWMPRWNA